MKPTIYKTLAEAIDSLKSLGSLAIAEGILMRDQADPDSVDEKVFFLLPMHYSLCSFAGVRDQRRVYSIERTVLVRRQLAGPDAGSMDGDIVDLREKEGRCLYKDLTRSDMEGIIRRMQTEDAESQREGAPGVYAHVTITENSGLYSVIVQDYKSPQYHADAALGILERS